MQTYTMDYIIQELEKELDLANLPKSKKIRKGQNVSFRISKEDLSRDVVVTKLKKFFEDKYIGGGWCRIDADLYPGYTSVHIEEN